MANQSTSIDQSLSWRPQSSPPSNPVLGEVYLDALTNNLYKWNGSIWVIFGGNTVGAGVRVAGGSLAVTPGAPIKWDKVEWNYDNAYDPSTGLFTVPENAPGVYLVTGAIQTGTADSFFVIVNNNANVDANKYLFQQPAALGGEAEPYTAVVKVDAGNTIYVVLSASVSIGGAGTSHMQITWLGGAK